MRKKIQELLGEAKIFTKSDKKEANNKNEILKNKMVINDFQSRIEKSTNKNSDIIILRRRKYLNAVNKNENEKPYTIIYLNIYLK